MEKRARTFALCLILIVTCWALVFSQVGADKRPPKTSPPKTQPKRTTTRTPSPAPRSKPRQTAPNIEMVLVPTGSFMMGSPDRVGVSNEHPQHQVTVQSFYIGKYEVTQAQYQAVMGTNPSNFKGDDLPVDNVSWDEAQEFCRKLSQVTGKKYRLPTEAEWEYACRAGTTGDYAGNLDSMAWYGNNSGRQYIDADEIWMKDTNNYTSRLQANGNRTHEVGTKLANGFGLYDMHGNVWEWCEDWYHDSYNGAPTDGSAWLSGGGQYRVLRGGSWNRFAYGLRSAYRLWVTPDDRGSSGFRVVAFART